MSDGSTEWTIERIAEGLAAPEVCRRFLDEIWRAPVDELLGVFANWQRVAADLEAGAERGRALLAQAGPDGALPGQWHVVSLETPRPMTADALRAVHAYPEDSRDPRPGDR